MLAIPKGRKKLVRDSERMKLNGPGIQKSERKRFLAVGEASTAMS